MVAWLTAAVLYGPAIALPATARETGIVAVPLRPAATRGGPGETAVVSTYREYPPGPEMVRVVACAWHGVAGWPRRMRVLPDGCLDLVWDGQRARAVRPAAGPVRHLVGAGREVTGIRIRPGWGGTVLGLPLRLLLDVTDLGDLWDPAAARCLETALSAAPTAAARRQALQRAITGRLTLAAGPDPEVLGAVQLLGQPAASAGHAASSANLSTRQLRRRFDDHVGLPPKTLHAILRFQRLRAWLASPGSGAATLARGAAECGYFDHAHLCRECRRLADLTPGTLLAAMTDHREQLRASQPAETGN